MKITRHKKNNKKRKTVCRIKRQSTRKSTTKNKFNSNKRYTRKQMKNVKYKTPKKKRGGYKLCDKASEIKPYVKQNVQWFKKLDEQLRKDVLCKMNSASLNTYLEPSKGYDKNFKERNIGIGNYKHDQDNLYSGCYGESDHTPSIFSLVDWVNGFNTEKKYGLTSYK